MMGRPAGTEVFCKRTFVGCVLVAVSMRWRIVVHSENRKWASQNLCCADRSLVYSVMPGQDRLPSIRINKYSSMWLWISHVLRGASRGVHAAAEFFELTITRPATVISQPAKYKPNYRPLYCTDNTL